MQKRKMMVIIIAAVIASIWLFAGYAAAQPPGTQADLDNAMNTVVGKTADAFASGLAAHGYIAVFIHRTGSFFVPLNQNFDHTNASGRPQRSIVQFTSFQYNPTCYWYVDPNGQLRQRCI